MDFKGQWVWVTGASSGLGQELARQLAGVGANLVLTARRAERLEQLRTEVVPRGVEVKVLPGDLGSHADIDRLMAAVKEVPLSAAVLNAGTTHFGHHHELSWAEFEAMLQLNVVGTARVTSELVQHFRASRAQARIMLVTSMAGLWPVPFQSAYSGTKAFLTAFGTALAHELEGTGISVTVFAPGGIATEMTAGERFGPLKGWLAPADEVAREAVEALRARPPLHVPGFLNRLGNVAFRLFPRSFVMGQVARQYRKALEATTKKS
jgi:short-subunit dehydrogenase